MMWIMAIILAAPWAIASSIPIETVAAVIAGEARGEGRTGMMAVAEVIRQRSLETGTPPNEVVMHGFSCINRESPKELYRRLLNAGGSDFMALKYAERLAAWLFVAPHRLSNLTRCANHYHEVSICPSWSKSPEARRTAIIGRHVFYRLDKK